MNPRRGSRVVFAAALATALVLPGAALAAESGHGGGHSTSGDTGSLYSDLVVAYRAQDGTPLLKEYFMASEEEPAGEYSFCVQPATYAAVPGLRATDNPLGGKDVTVLPLQGEWIGLPAEQVPVAEIEPCDVQPAYSMFVSEAELERLNLGRTADDVLARKLSDVETKLRSGDEITLDAAGRIAIDGAALDASPEYAAIYSSLMSTGTIPGLSTEGGLAAIEQPDATTPGFTYGPYELAAVAIGTAAGKSVPITVDTVQYYNRVVGFADADPAPGWGIKFLQSPDPDGPGTIDRTVLPGKEKFVDYSGFTYDRAKTFTGSVTWLDVPSLSWEVSPILDVVEFTELSEAGIGGGQLTGLTGFTQMADDVRAVISYLHENEVIAGFYMDPVGVDTTDEQHRALRDAAVDLAGVPAEAFAGLSFPFTASVYNPWKAANTIDNGELRLRIVGPVGLTAEHVTLSLAGGTALTLDALLTASIPMNPIADPGYRLEQPLELSLGPDAPAGDYSLELELWNDPDGAGADPAVQFENEGGGPVEDSAAFQVHDYVTTLMWGGDVAAVATQGSNIALPVRVFSPGTGTVDLTVSVEGPVDTTLVEGNVSLRRFDGTSMVSRPLASVEGTAGLSTTVTEPVVAGYNDIGWHLSVAEGAPIGAYSVHLGLPAGSPGVDLAEPVSIDVLAPEDHKSPNAPVVEHVEVAGDSATITVSSSDNDVVRYDFVLIKEFTHLKEVSSTDGSMTFDGLSAGTYKVNITAFDRAGNASDTVATTFVVAGSSTGTDPGTGTTPTTPPTTPPAEDPADPPAEDPGDQPEEAGPPETSIVKGLKDNGWLLRHRVTYRLRSNGEDAAYRVRLDGRQLKECTASLCTIEGLTAGTHRVSFAAAAGDQVDPTPVVRTFTVPRNLEQLRYTRQWTFRDSVRAFADVAEAKQRGEVVRTRAHNIKRIALVASKGVGHGKVKVFLGERLLKRISLENASAQRRVMIHVRTFDTAQRGLVRVVVVSDGKPVRLHGIGIATR